MRGALTKRIVEIGKRRLGVTLSLAELRLMPYVQYVMLNEQVIDPRKINDEEVELLETWEQRGWVRFTPPRLRTRLKVSRKFWNAIHEILWHGYVEFGLA